MQNVFPLLFCSFFAFIIQELLQRERGGAGEAVTELEYLATILLLRVCVCVCVHKIQLHSLARLLTNNLSEEERNEVNLSVVEVFFPCVI